MSVVALLVLSLSQQPEGGIVSEGMGRGPEALTARQGCQTESLEVFDRPAVELTAEVERPKTLAIVPPDHGHLAGASGDWRGVALVDATGRVRRVWQTRGVKDEADAVIGDAVLQWRYTPARVAGRPVPACVPIWVRVRK